MKNILKSIDWFFDYYLGYFFYNGYKIDNYDTYMKNKWGDKYERRNKV